MINDQNRHHLTPFFGSDSDALASEKITSSKQDQSLHKSKGLLEETKLVATWLYQKPKNTRRGYESDIKKFFAYYKGKSLKQIESAHIVVFFKNHPELKESSKARLRSAISSLYRFLIRQRYLNFNPAEGVDPISVPDSTHEKVLTLEEVKEMISREPNPRNKFLIELLLRTGLRVSEAISLHKTNFRKNGESCYLSVTGKGNKTRSIRIDSELFCRAIELSSELGGKTPVFRAKNTKKAISAVSAWKIIQKAGERIGFSNISPHWLRHTHATLSLQLGDDLRVIQHTLGHDSIVTTTKYTKVFPSQSSGQKIKI